MFPDPFDPDIPARPAIREIYGVYMPTFGHKVTWITPSREKGRKIRRKIFKDVEVFTIPWPRTTSKPLKIHYFILYLFTKYMFLAKKAKGGRYDIIQVRNDVYGALLAFYIKRRYKIPFVFQYSFPNYDVKATHKIIRSFLNYFLFTHILHKADFVFPISKWMETELIKEGIPKSKMMPLPMGVNPELFSQNKDGMEIF